MSLPRYEQYKESGVEWLGEVPEHWVVKRLGYFFNERREKVSDKDFEPLSVTKNGILPQLETAAKSDDGDNRKKVCAGDFVINSRSDRKGSSGMAVQDGSISLINTVIQPYKDIYILFAHHLLRSAPFQEEYYRYGKGIVADLWSTNFSEMRNISLAIPSISEQQAIAAFLERETTKIDALVSEQERLTAILKEKRQAVISHAVTKGLNPDATMKDSRIEWLGEVPEGWKVLRVKHLTRNIEQGWSPQCEGFPVESSDEWGVLKVGCVNGGKFNPLENKSLPSELEPLPELGIKAGDLLISRANTRELVGSAAVAEQNFPNLLLCDKLYRVRLVTEICIPEFLVRYLGEDKVRGQIKLAASGASSTMQNIGQSTILEMSIAVPSLKEQSTIVAFLDSETAKIDTLVGEAQQAVSLLKERRGALISAAVTGKIDVRQVIQ